jgi:hypothetical protein
MKRFARNVVFLALILVPISTRAQGMPALVTRLEAMFAKEEPKWKLERPYVQLNPPVMHFKSAQGDALIYVFIMDSVKSAGEAFEGSTIAFGNTMGARGRKSSLPKFGDENFMFTRFVAGGTTSIHFRQGNIYIEVTAPTQVTAKRFAQHVMNQILASAKMQSALHYYRRNRTNRWTGAAGACFVT